MAAVYQKTGTVAQVHVDRLVRHAFHTLKSTFRRMPLSSVVRKDLCYGSSYICERSQVDETLGYVDCFPDSTFCAGR